MTVKDLPSEPSTNHWAERQAYHEHPALGSGDVRRLCDSWAAFEAARRTPFKATAASSIGSATHLCLLEPHRAGELTPWVADCGTRTAKAYLDLAGKAPKGAIILLAPELERVTLAVRGALRNPLVARILDGAQCEQEIYWDEPLDRYGRSGKLVQGKGLIDFVPANGLELGDLKTTSDEIIDADAWGRTLASHAYPVQAAWYRRGWAERHPWEGPRGWVWIVVQTVEPYLCELYRAHPTDLAWGDSRCERALRRYATHHGRPEVWQGHSQADADGWPTIETVEMARWGRKGEW